MAERILFVTGKLADPALRRTLAPLAAQVGFVADVAVLPITVAALLTTSWIARKLVVPESTNRVVLPGLCLGPLEPLAAQFGVPFERGPEDLRDLPSHFGKSSNPSDYGKYSIEIIAEINHAPRLTLSEIIALSDHYRASGADVIDLGCDPGITWSSVGPAVAELRASGARVSIDSFNPQEVHAALAAGAELVLSVNSTNVDFVRDWHTEFPAAEVVAIPDTPRDLASLERTADKLAEWGVPHRLDPILEPIGFGFAQSLERYLTLRNRFPDAKLMMGVGNVTELTDADSAGINVVLAAICEELSITSVLTTEVVNWARSSVTELNLARRLVHHAITHGVLPKYLEPGLVQLRDRKRPALGDDAIQELADNITDRNYRIIAERGELHVLSRQGHLRAMDPFQLFEQLAERDPKLDVSHAFYLGFEMAKAVTALTLDKNYTQDRALDWGHLTRPETSHRATGVPT